MTADAPWHPASDSFANAEEKFKVAAATVTVRNGNQNSIAASSVPRMLAAFQTYDTAFHAGNPELDADANGDELYNQMIAAVRMQADSYKPEKIPTDPDEYFKYACKALTSIRLPKEKYAVTPEALAKRWNIGLVKARNT
ncbi:hypothetical protein ACA910_019807 [Epithemia clementina (nom. ined.)]